MAGRQKNNRWRATRRGQETAFGGSLLRRLSSPLLLSCWIVAAVVLLYVYWLRAPRPEVGFRGFLTKLPDPQVSESVPWDVVIDQPGLGATSSVDTTVHASGSRSSNTRRLQDILGDVNDARVGVFYFELPGVVLADEDRPALLPSNWLEEPAEQRDVVTLATKCQEIEQWLSGDSNTSAKRDPDRYAIVVLDCQVSAQLWSRGLYGKDFVKEAKDYLQRRLQEPHMQNVVVLLSCDEKQVSWVEPSLGASIFGHLFLEGIQGQADGVGQVAEDERISVAELCAYLVEEVAKWVRERRYADQDVVVMTSPRCSPDVWQKVYLNTYRHTSLNRMAGRGATFPAESQRTLRQPNAALEQDRNGRLQTLEELWTRCYSQWDVTIQTEQLDPHYWVQIFQHLLDAEYALRHGAARAFDFSSRAAKHRLKELEHRDSDRWHTLGYSLAWEQLVSQNQQLRAGATEGGERESRNSDVDVQALPGGGPVPPAKQDTPASSAAEGACGEPVQQRDASPGRSGAAAQDAATTQPVPALDEDSDVAAANAIAPDVKTGGGTEAGTEQASRDGADELPVETESGGLLPARLVARFMQGRGTAGQVADRRVQASEMLLPVELEAVVMSVADRGISLGESPQVGWEDDLREVLRARIQLEKTWCAAGGYAPYVTRWLELWLREADHAQRRREDLLWNYGGTPLLAGAVDVSRPDERRDVAVFMEQVATSLQKWERALALSPFLLRLNLEQGSSTKEWVPPSFSRRVLEVTRLQFGALSEMTAQFRSPPTNLDQWLRQLESLGRQLTESSQQLQAEIASEMEQIGEAEEVTTTWWRRIDRLLRFPVIGGGSAAERASRRMQLVHDSMESVLETKQLQVSAAMDTTTEQQLSVISWQKGQLELLDLFSELDGSELLSARSGAGSGLPADLWRDMAQSVMQQDVANRILLRFVIGDTPEARGGAEVDRNCRREWASFYCRLGTRRLEDFWGRQVNGRAYYQRVSNRCLEVAETLRKDEDLADLHRAQGRQKDLNDIVLHARYQDEGRAGLVQFVQDVPGGLRADQNTQWFGKDARSMTARLQLEPGFPTGVLSLRPPRVDQIELVSSGRVKELSARAKLTLRRSSLGFGVDGPLDFQLWYRGHRWRTPAMLQVISEEEWGVLDVRAGELISAKLSVESAQRERVKTSVLFVLDCSRSMAQDNRMETLVKTLGQFARLVQGSQIQVGVRLFGHRYEWRPDNPESELKARQDSELKMKLKAFDEPSLVEFKQLLKTLAPRGETPLLYSLLKTVEDFQDVNAGRKLVILVTDGMDNWGQSQESVEQLQKLSTVLPAAGIRVNAVGFDSDQEGFEQLQRIAESTGGTAVDATSSRLLSRLLAVLEPYYYRVQTHGTDEQVVPSRLLPLGPSKPLEMSAGIVDVFVMNQAHQPVAVRRSVRIDPGQTHRLYYQTGQLSYGPPSFRQDLAHSSREEQPVLRVVQAERTAKGPLRITVSLADEQDPSWVPELLWLDLQTLDGEPRRYILPGIPPNDAVGRFPAWTFNLTGWDDSAARIKLLARWVSREQLQESRQVFPWKVGDINTPVVDGMTVTRNDYPVEFNGEGGWARLTFVAAEDSRLMPWELQLLNPEWTSAAALSIHPRKRLATFYYKFRGGHADQPQVLVPPAHLGQRRELNLRLSLGSVVVPSQGTR